eukprot:SAG11_NODE_3176_length_2631_cov_1.661532_3_plen_339_part_00
MAHAASAVAAGARAAPAYANSARAGTSSSAPWGVLGDGGAAFGEAACAAQLEAKRQGLMAALLDEGLPLQVLEGARTVASTAVGHRHRAQFGVQRHADVEDSGSGGRAATKTAECAARLQLYQFDGASRTRVVASSRSLPILSAPICVALDVLEELTTYEVCTCSCRAAAPGTEPEREPEPEGAASTMEEEAAEEGGAEEKGDSVPCSEYSVLWRQLCAVNAHSTSSGSLLLTLVYRRTWDKRAKLKQKGEGRTLAPPPPHAESWLRAALQLRMLLRCEGVGGAEVVGCWRGHRLCTLDSARLEGGRSLNSLGPCARERFQLSDGRVLHYDQPEGQCE